MNPDCRDGKHRACSGTAWDDDADALTDCPCPCHASARHAADEPASSSAPHAPMMRGDGSSTPIPEAPVTDQPSTPEPDDEPDITPTGRVRAKKPKGDGRRPVTGL